MIADEHAILRGLPVGAAHPDELDRFPERRIACMMLLGGYFGAQHGDQADSRWVASPQAKLLAELVGLPAWPPGPDLQFSPDQLELRALNLAGPVHVSRTRYGKRVTQKEKRLRRRAAHNGLFKRAGAISATPSTVVSFWSQYVNVSYVIVGE